MNIKTEKQETQEAQEQETQVKGKSFFRERATDYGVNISEKNLYDEEVERAEF